ncbi:MAG: Hsp20/alpha crystallin family protein [Candidatus Micrarchaeaceae archaeon]
MPKMAKKARKRASRAELLSPIAQFDEFFDPFRAIRNLVAFPSRYFSSAFGEVPSIDVVDEGNSIRVVADLPGVRKEDIRVSIENNLLTIRASRREEKEKEEKNYYFSERAEADYYRRLPLPVEVNPDSAQAKFENGTLEVRIEKAESAKGKEVKVE